MLVSCVCGMKQMWRATLLRKSFVRCAWSAHCTVVGEKYAVRSIYSKASGETAKRRARTTYQTCYRLQRASSCCRRRTLCCRCCYYRRRILTRCWNWSQSLSSRQIRHGLSRAGGVRGSRGAIEVANKVARGKESHQCNSLHLPPVLLLLLVEPNPPKPVLWLLLLEPKPPKPPKDMVLSMRRVRASVWFVDFQCAVGSRVGRAG